MNHDTNEAAPLHGLLWPRSVAIVGASDNIHKIGGRPLHYLLGSGYTGRILPVNQRGGLVQGVESYPSLDALPEVPDSVILSVPAEAALALERHGLCLGDELETGWFQGYEIDLGGFVREILTLAVPVQPLCKESCLGLCPRCGADRNAGPCGCDPARPKSAFAALEALRTRGES